MINYLTYFKGRYNSLTIHTCIPPKKFQEEVHFQTNCVQREVTQISFEYLHLGILARESKVENRQRLTLGVFNPLLTLTMY